MSLLLTFTSVLSYSVVNGQVKRQFNVENTSSCESIKLRVKANSGNCFVKPSQNADILNVFSNQDTESFSHNFTKEIVGKTCVVNLSLEEVESSGFSQSISTRFFGASDKASSGSKYWKMYLSDAKPYLLDLSYGVGNANVDLSGLSIKNLKINTGSADVSVGYSSLENKIDMDTFAVKVDMGSVKVKNLNLARSHYVKADVGFGNMMLDFSGTPIGGNKIKGSVGAGNLIIILPDKDVPVLVTIHDSWLCSVNMTADFKKTGNQTFANAAYEKNPKNPVVFDLDVSMGNIVFKDKFE